MSASARSLQGDVCINDGIGQVAFRDVMSGAHYEEIDPFACFSFTNIRNTSKSGVLHFVSIFSKLEATILRPAAGAIACGTNSAIVVEMDEGDLEVLKSHFASQGMSETALDSKIRSKPKWYRIFDENFRHQVIVLLMDTSNAWKNFR